MRSPASWQSMPRMEMSWKPLKGTAAVRPSRLMAEHSTTGLPWLGASEWATAPFSSPLSCSASGGRFSGRGGALGGVVLLFVVGAAAGDGQQREAEQRRSGAGGHARRDDSMPSRDRVAALDGWSVDRQVVGPGHVGRATARPLLVPVAPRQRASRDCVLARPAERDQHDTAGPALTSWRRTGPGDARDSIRRPACARRPRTPASARPRARGRPPPGARARAPGCAGRAGAPAG